MASTREFRLPDIGDFESVDVVEVLVSAGDAVDVDDSLIVLESDKATMEVPSPFRGTVKEMRVRVGDQVSEGDPIAVIEVEEDADAPEKPAADADGARAGAASKARTPADAEPSRTEAPADAEPAGAEAPADAEPSRADAPADAEPPGTDTGPGPEPSRTGAADAEPSEDRAEASAPEHREAPARETGGPAEPSGAAAALPRADDARPSAKAHASPSVRRLARELGADLALVPGSGRKGRITREDVQAFVKASLSRGTAAGVPIAGVRVAAPVEVDFAKFGPTEIQPLNRIRRLSAANLHRSWVTVPHVTQFDEADITDLDVFRREQKAAAEESGVKLTFLPFVVKACTAALAEFPQFNASLDPTGENLVLKRYFHIGVAVETENGLVVPVVRDADRKGLFALAGALGDLSERARNRRLSPADLQGGTFSISSLGGIGGTFFTPIVNHPEVAILGVSRMDWKPVWRDGAFVPRLVLPLSLSYDHRVIDGADAVRFTRRVAEFLSDLRRLLV